MLLRPVKFKKQKLLNQHQVPKELLEWSQSLQDQNLCRGTIWRVSRFFFLTFSGYDRRLPGFERYSVLGTDDNGMFNLQIVNATLEDDAIFECQVGPSLNNRPIRASARVNVMRKSIHPKKGFETLPWTFHDFSGVAYL